MNIFYKNLAKGELILPEHARTRDFFIAILISLFFLTIVTWISYFGAPLTDESFPIATALRFIQGQRPFIDDFSPYIPIGLLLAPIVKLSLWIHHGKNELILFLRHAYIIFTLGIAVYTFTLIKQSLPFLLAFFMSAAMIIYHPFGINNFHYDTLSVLLWTSVLFQFFSFQFFTPKTYQLIIFSICNALLCATYPTFLFFLLPFYLLYSSRDKNANRMWISHIIVGSIVLALAAALIFLQYHVSIEDLSNTLAFSKRLFMLSSEKGFFNKFRAISHSLKSIYTSYLLTAVSILCMGYFFRKKPFLLSIAIYSVFLLPFVFIKTNYISYTEIFYILNCAGIAGLFLFLLFLRNDDTSKKLFFFIGLPALMAGLLTSSTSYNLALNFNLGFFPACILGYIFAFLAIEKYTSNLKKNYLFSRSLLILGSLIFGFCQIDYIYGTSVLGFNLYHEAKKFPLTGPFYGLYIENPFNQLLVQLQKDVKYLDIDSSRFVYFGTVSSGYLLVDQLKPGDYLLFSPYHLAHFEEKIRLPAYVFDFSHILGLPEKDIQNYLSSDKLNLVQFNAQYSIYGS
ncbi:MAG TPA: hypothetical protein VLI69_08730 [Gammaproteobacteria bacterium]|nr:hypothetical protein [Gammaproteobacteria bacterium]